MSKILSENKRALLNIVIKALLIFIVFMLVFAGTFVVLFSPQAHAPVLQSEADYTASPLAISTKAKTPPATGPLARRGTDLRVNLDGKFIPISEPILIVEGRTYLPLRALGELIGAETYFDSVNGIAAQTRNGTLIETFSGSPYLIVNDSESIRVDEDNHGQRAFVWYWNNRMYLPVRQVCTVLGLGVDWDGDNGIIYLTTGAQKPVWTQETAITIDELVQKMKNIADHDKQQEANLKAGLGREGESKPVEPGISDGELSSGGDWKWDETAEDWELR